MRIKDFLDARRVCYKVYSHEETHDAQHLAAALRVPGQNVAKTVLLRANGGYRYLVAVLPATEQVDLRRVGEGLGGADVRLACEWEVAECAPDCEFGILPPFGSQFGAATIVDESLSRHSDIFLQGDKHDEAIRMNYSDFYDLEHPLVLPIARRHAEAEVELDVGVVD